MASRRWPRFLLALLLLWQLNAAFAAPHVSTAMQPGSAPATHCERHAHAALGEAGLPTGGPTPPAPDCCRDVPAGCHCAQPPALSMTTLDIGATPPPGAPPAPSVTRRIDARGADFFRPPI